MKCTLSITQRCNLVCDYCYIQKNNSTMSLTTAENIVDKILFNSGLNEKIEIGYFGGEPLLEFGLIKDITNIIRKHKSYSPDKVVFTITTNGTILSVPIIEYIRDNKFVLCISCDGPAHIQNRHRHFKDGQGSSDLVEENIKRAIQIFPFTPVNAVYSPKNLESLPQVVEYLVSLGVERIFLNPDISAAWTAKEAAILPDVFAKIGQLYLDYYLNGQPKHISLIDSKIAAIFNRGYQTLEKCRMGNGELAFGPSGNIYPCERLIGSDEGNIHCLGNINSSFDLQQKCRRISTSAINTECFNCGLSEYCMNWCGCTNYTMTGAYNVAAPFLCASEKAAINCAFEIIRSARKKNINILHGSAAASLPDLSTENDTALRADEI